MQNLAQVTLETGEYFIFTTSSGRFTIWKQGIALPILPSAFSSYASYDEAVEGLNDYLESKEDE